MRLIDADKLENDVVENITVKAVSRMLAITQGQPTVNAIPIEWIYENAGKYFSGLEVLHLYKMIEDWGKENGKDSK